MKIIDQISSILEHPFTKESITKYNNGDDKDLRHLLFEIFTHTWLTVNNNVLKVYRQNKRLNYPMIIEAIQECPPPENLNLKLPFVQIAQSCKVVTLVPKIKLPKNYRIPNQLEIEFITKKATKKVALILEQA